MTEISKFLSEYLSIRRVSDITSDAVRTFLDSTCEMHFYKPSRRWSFVCEKRDNAAANRQRLSSDFTRYLIEPAFHAGPFSSASNNILYLVATSTRCTGVTRCCGEDTSVHEHFAVRASRCEFRVAANDRALKRFLVAARPPRSTRR